MNNSWCNQVLWLPQMVRKNTSRRWDLQSEVGPPIGGVTSNQRCDFQLEVTPPIRGDTSNWRWDSNQRWHLQLEVGPPIGGVTSNWRWDLWSEVGPLIGGGTSDWRWLMHVAPHRGTYVTCRNQLFFWKKKRLFIVDYIKPSPVYQVKCKLVIIEIGFNITLR